MEAVVRQIGESANLLQAEDAGMVWIAAMLIIGAFWCFLGYKFMRLWITLVGGLIGGIGGYYITEMYSENILVLAIVAILSCIIVGMISYHIYIIGVFLICMVVGISLSSLVLQPNSSLTFFLCVIIGVIIGMLAVKFVKSMLILSTGMQGGMMMAAGIMALIKVENNLYFGAIGLVIGIIGCVVQFLTAPHKKEDKGDDDKHTDRGR